MIKKLKALVCIAVVYSAGAFSGGRSSCSKNLVTSSSRCVLARQQASVRSPKSRQWFGMSSVDATTTSKCPVTKVSNQVDRVLSFVDRRILRRTIRLADHAPALLSLFYFGAVSMASMMGMGPMASGSEMTAAVTPKATILSVLVNQRVGPTSNTAFSALFPTLITPAPFVFLVWPVIAVLQLVTLVISAIYPKEEEFLSQTELSSLTVANLCSAAWLLVSSKATAGALPVASFLILPLVPLFSAYPLRNKPTYILPAFQLYSSFTLIASFLAFAVELQHGGRIPFFGTFSAEIAASIFLTLYSIAGLSLQKKSVVKRVVNFGALTGILVKRVGDSLVGGAVGLFSLALSVSFWYTAGIWYWSTTELLKKPSKE
mmetsp:Transcript_33281/g.48690  ORF Transcript_33281/g.48690 Transcript_33281/m.48690 type:complete len:374 (+) Transcript_33281:92-1213(+)|eukprot:CAMPEP_0206384154 /NCGR_PEP_ID=MMETSP0294-20121207/14396_1 /ASSEMBLY_ACC=CAM_ASM_000327 /TAXON_ID=39354 /ORGANISM="Heterosigma akashiwo, Strain CCMP2393" /LENGTH=373 /DNA_ID=CAMNT_0053834391 /DNA_START=39 /DNA_END=1160 /DNA_ORIENTATION=-